MMPKQELVYKRANENDIILVLAPPAEYLNCYISHKPSLAAANLLTN